MPLEVGEGFSEDNNGDGRGKILLIINLPRNIHLPNRNIRLPKGFPLQLQEAEVSPGGETIISLIGGGGGEGVVSPSLERKLLRKGRTLQTSLWVSSTIIASCVTKFRVDHSTLIVDILGGPKFMRQIVATA